MRELTEAGERDILILPHAGKALGMQKDENRGQWSR